MVMAVANGDTSRVVADERRAAFKGLLVPALDLLRGTGLRSVLALLLAVVALLVLVLLVPLLRGLRVGVVGPDLLRLTEDLLLRRGESKTSLAAVGVAATFETSSLGLLLLLLLATFLLLLIRFSSSRFPLVLLPVSA
jgi:hypothetical protein